MFKKCIDTWLNNGVYAGNGDALNRKIRMSNLVAGFTIIVLSLYIPVFLYYRNAVDMAENFVFMSAAIVNFPLLRARRYTTAFFLLTTVGYVYMTLGGILYGLDSHLHYFLLVMCAIAAVMFNSKTTIKIYLAAGIVAFFAVEFYMKGRAPLIGDVPEIRSILEVVSYTNLFVLFLIICIFILFFKYDNLRYQHEIEKKNAEIAEKNREMTDSINYAQRLQNGLLPAKEELLRLFPGSFIYYNPKDIVSGDFYWYHQKDNHIYIACGDCTGHGVPGALMSVLGINLLAEIVESGKAHDPAVILEHLRTGIIRALNRDTDKGEYKDGMDLSFAKIDAAAGTCWYAGANNPLYHFSNNELQEHRPDKQPVGYNSVMKPFTCKSFAIQPGDCLVFFTDGYADQFGGPSNKKFTYRAFREVLKKAIAGDPANAVEVLHAQWLAWRGNLEQIDDVCVMGVRI